MIVHDERMIEGNRKREKEREIAKIWILFSSFNLAKQGIIKSVTTILPDMMKNMILS